MSLQDMINETLKNQNNEVKDIVKEEIKTDEVKTDEVKTEEVKDIVKEEIKTDEVKKKTEKFTPSRGFTTLKQAEKFVESSVFDKWDDASKKEFKKWLEKIKED